MTIDLLIPRPATVREIVRGVVRQQLNASLWRITRQSGEVLGYVEYLGEVGHRYRAKRMLPDRRGFIAYGDFDEIDEAVEVLRY
ncbi:MAG: hypothetical protein ACTH31_07900 [Pseudoclavibacter sp.]